MAFLLGLACVVGLIVHSGDVIIPTEVFFRAVGAILFLLVAWVFERVRARKFVEECTEAEDKLVVISTVDGLEATYWSHERAHSWRVFMHDVVRFALGGMADRRKKYGELIRTYLVTAFVWHDGSPKDAGYLVDFAITTTLREKLSWAPFMKEPVWLIGESVRAKVLAIGETEEGRRLISRCVNPAKEDEPVKPVRKHA